MRSSGKDFYFSLTSDKVNYDDSTYIYQWYIFKLLYNCEVWKKKLSMNIMYNILIYWIYCLKLSFSKLYIELLFFLNHFSLLLWKVLLSSAFL